MKQRVTLNLRGALTFKDTYNKKVLYKCIYIFKCTCVYSFIKVALSHNYLYVSSPWGFPGGSVAKNLPVNAGDAGSIPGSARSP